MKIPIFAVILLVGLCIAAVLGQGKHGFADYASQQSFGQQPVALGYTKVQQQQLAAAQKTASQPQIQYYTQPTAVKYVNAPVQQQQQQYQYEPQQFAYTQPSKVAAAAAPVAQKVPQYSLANDVSSFAYSSPIVSYNSLGLLAQVAGKSAGTKSTYSSVGAPVAASAPVAPAPAAYQLPAQKVAYANPAKIPQYFTSSAGGPQQYQQPQQQYVSAAQYSSPQTYSISQPSAHYSQNQDDSQYTQGQAYAQTAAQPQYYTVPQVKYANPGASYSQ